MYQWYTGTRQDPHADDDHGDVPPRRVVVSSTSRSACLRGAADPTRPVAVVDATTKVEELAGVKRARLAGNRTTANGQPFGPYQGLRFFTDADAHAVIRYVRSSPHGRRLLLLLTDGAGCRTRWMRAVQGWPRPAGSISCVQYRLQLPASQRGRKKNQGTTFHQKRKSNQQQCKRSDLMIGGSRVY